MRLNNMLKVDLKNTVINIPFDAYINDVKAIDAKIKGKTGADQRLL